MVLDTKEPSESRYNETFAWAIELDVTSKFKGKVVKAGFDHMPTACGVWTEGSPHASNYHRFTEAKKPQDSRGWSSMSTGQPLEPMATGHRHGPR